MKKMFLALSLLAVAPIFAEDVNPTVTKIEEKSYLAKAKDAVVNGYTSVSNAIEAAGTYVPGHSYVSDYVITPARNNVKVAMAVVAVATYAVVKASTPSVEAEL